MLLSWACAAKAGDLRYRGMPGGPQASASDVFARRRPPSGRQVSIVAGETSATVTEVGAGLREFGRGSRAIVAGYGAGEMCTSGRGQVLMPWPNRLEDGSYRFGGVDAVAALDEPSAHNAIHGLARWANWSLAALGEDTASASCDLPAQPGFPFVLALRLVYRVGEDGDSSFLSVEATATNAGSDEGAVPFGAGFHPYLALFGGVVDTALLEVPAETVLVSDERGLPRGRRRVEGTDLDFRREREIGGLRLDHCFTDLSGDGGWRVSLRIRDGSLTEIWADSSFPYVMCFTGDTLAPHERRRSIAVEPMSCPPNALRSGESLAVLRAGETWRGRWGISWRP